MISIPKSQLISATTQVIPNILRPVVLSVPGLLKESKKIVEKPHKGLSVYSLSKTSITRSSTVTTGLATKQQVRFAHTDNVQPQSFSYYRRNSCVDATKPTEEGDTSTKAYSYLILGGAAVTSVYMAQKMVQSVVGSLNLSADTLALGKTEINLNEIPEGKSLTFKWRGKPLFVRHRTPKEIETETSVDLSGLRDPQHDADRAQRAEWLVVIGICTHLGCIPIHNAGNFGGYFCPCHGSHYDGSGRIRKGPAPLNLEVPYYQFTEDNLLIVG